MNRIYGTDPEYPVYLENWVDNIPNIIPPMALIKDYGVKFTEREDGKKVLYDSAYGQVIEDGAAVELNLKPLGEAVALNSYVKNLLQAFEQDVLHPINPELQFSKTPYGYFDTVEYWEKRDEDFRECVIFGCDPDFIPEIYKLLNLENPNDEQEVLDVSQHDARYFGGHLHVQNMSDNPNIYIDSQKFVGVVFDFIVGTTNVNLLRTPIIEKLEKKRLEFYGRPGHGRLQKYKDGLNGYEYRPLSNYWLNSVANTAKILANASIAATIVEYGLAELFAMEFEDNIPELWNALINFDKETSMKFLEKSLEWTLNSGIISIKDLGDCL
jgi:hypothetical protein